MGRLGITYREVFNAANDLQGQGFSPTVDAVRAKLGSGSKSTIVPYLRQWKSEHLPSQAIIREDLPPELLFVVKDWYKRLTVSKDFEMDDLKREVNNLLVKNAELTQKLNQAEKENLFLREEKSILKLELMELEKELKN